VVPVGVATKASLRADGTIRAHKRPKERKKLRSQMTNARKHPDGARLVIAPV
jgi:hypothetical protein